MMESFMLLGSGELGKEFAIAAKRYGYKVIAVDRYPNAPAMQVSDHSEVIDMLDPSALETVVKKHNPTHIVPEVESICVDKLFDFEKQGLVVVPSAYAVSVTMNRKKTRELAQQLGIRTAKTGYADSYDSLCNVANTIGYPCVIKPLMSSSGKGQSIAKNFEDLEQCWSTACTNGRNKTQGVQEVQIEEFIDFQHEITLLTITRKDKDPKFCYPIGHLQKNGDFQESWQPHTQISCEQYNEAKSAATKMVNALGGCGIWGVEFFLLEDGGIYFSELSPRPHDTGMVTMVTQYQNEFELHLRAILNWKTMKDMAYEYGYSKVILSDTTSINPICDGLKDVSGPHNVQVRIFGKPCAYPGRRMGVVMGFVDNKLEDEVTENVYKQLEDKVKGIAECIRVVDSADRNVLEEQNNEQKDEQKDKLNPEQKVQDPAVVDEDNKLTLEQACMWDFLVVSPVTQDAQNAQCIPSETSTNAPVEDNNVPNEGGDINESKLTGYEASEEPIDLQDHQQNQHHQLDLQQCNQDNQCNQDLINFDKNLDHTGDPTNKDNNTDEDYRLIGEYALPEPNQLNQNNRDISGVTDPDPSDITIPDEDLLAPTDSQPNTTNIPRYISPKDSDDESDEYVGGGYANASAKKLLKVKNQ